MKKDYSNVQNGVIPDEDFADGFAEDKTIVLGKWVDINKKADLILLEN